MKIRYELANRKVVEVEVSQDLYEAISDFDEKARKRNRKETRYHNSAEQLEEIGFKFADYDADPLFLLERKEKKDDLHAAINKLLPQQQRLIQKAFFEGRTITSIAREEGVDESSVRERLVRIMNKMRTFLDTPPEKGPPKG